MKTRLGFFLFMALVLISIPFCSKDDPHTVIELTTRIKLVFDTAKVNQFNPDLTYGSVNDIDGNVYKTIQIGDQIWLAENLKTKRYNDGSQIPNVIWYNPDIYYTYKNKYGILYNHYVVNTGKLCPTGWHVPTDEEWKQLEMALGMSQASADTSYWNFDVYGMGFRGTDQGTQIKAKIGWSAWEGRNGNGTNTSGFSALPAGDTGGGSVGLCTTWWCYGDAWARTLSSDESKISRAIYYEHYGFSVRCLKD